MVLNIILKLDPAAIPSLFGTPNRSPVWCLDGAVVPSSIDLASGSVACVLQLSGLVSVRQGDRVISQMGGDGLVFVAGDEGVSLDVGSGLAPKSDSLVLGFSLSVIRETLSAGRPGLNEAIRGLLFSEDAGMDRAITLRMPTLIRERVIPDFRNPSVTGAARDFWYESRVREVIALCFFHEEQRSENFFCTRQKRIASERIAKTKAFILANLDQPFDLTSAAEVAGCSTHYLSRTFSESEGVTIIQFLRQARITRAAELLASGQYNVSEAAVEVGYQSLSHFSKAFQQEKGVLPSQYDSRR